VSSASFGKREREKKRLERAAEKRQRRLERAERTDPEQADTGALMERFHRLSESFASGAVDRDTYEAERREIFSDLGLTDALDG
jgi:hypothetical protein